MTKLVAVLTAARLDPSGRQLDQDDQDFLRQNAYEIVRIALQNFSCSETKNWEVLSLDEPAANQSAAVVARVLLVEPSVASFLDQWETFELIFRCVELSRKAPLSVLVVPDKLPATEIFEKFCALHGIQHEPSLHNRILGHRANRPGGGQGILVRDEELPAVVMDFYL